MGDRQPAQGVRPERAAGRDRGDREGAYGGREVNFSSDADAMIIYRPSGEADEATANRFARKVADDLRAILQGPVSLEQKIELDLDLRPEGKNGPLVRSYASCKEYYGSWASTWSIRRCCAPATPRATAR